MSKTQKTNKDTDPVTFFAKVTPEGVIMGEARSRIADGVSALARQAALLSDRLSKMETVDDLPTQEELDGLYNELNEISIATRVAYHKDIMVRREAAA